MTEYVQDWNEEIVQTGQELREHEQEHQYDCQKDARADSKVIHHNVSLDYTTGRSLDEAG